MFSAATKSARVATAANYIEDVFSTYLYNGNEPNSVTVNNGIDLSTKGGLVWIKARETAKSNWLWDTARGTGSGISSNTTGAAVSFTGVSAFNTNGFTVGSDSATNDSTRGMVSWTFREQPKFFDVVTYTGNGTQPRTITHNLGSVPGCIIVKRTDSTSDWAVYHRAVDATTPQGYRLELNTTNQRIATSTTWNNQAPTSTEFYIGSATYNASGGTYVAYLFAHNAGGFGLTGSDNVISCGSFTGGSPATVNLGYEPQWLLIKSATNADNWYIFDTMRGWTVDYSGLNYLIANSSGAENTGGSTSGLTNTGFNFNYGSGQTFIYIAIRRGPMKTPTSGTSVFYPNYYTGNSSANRSFTIGFPYDLAWYRLPDRGFNMRDVDRLRGPSVQLYTPLTSAESATASDEYLYQDKPTNTIVVGTPTSTDLNFSGNPYLQYLFRRAPGFFDVACFTTDGTTNQRVSHNLTVAPELIITKRRDGAGNWFTYSATLGRSAYLSVNSTAASNGFGDDWGTSNPTATDFGYNCQIFQSSPYSGRTVVAYLFATVAGVSKCGSYTGTGALQTINCGFTSGARFVLIKRTDSTGDWWVYDSARGITSGNDPYLFLNSTAAEVTGTNYVDTDTTGFKVTAAAPAGLNASGGTYIFLAIA